MEEEMICENCGSSMDAGSSHCPTCEAPADSGKSAKKRFGRLSLARLYSGGNKAEMPETGVSSESIEPDVQSDYYPDEVISSAEGVENDPPDAVPHRDVQKVEGTVPGDSLEDVVPSESAAQAEDMLESMEEDMPDGEEDEKIHQLQNILSGMATPDVEGESIDLDVEEDPDRMSAVPVRARAMKVGAPSQRIQTFVDGFDELLDGGIPDGSIVLLTGGAGTMKSSMAYYILYHNILSGGAKCLYVTLEQTLESLLGQMYSLGMNPELTQDYLRVFDMGYIRKHILKSKKDWFEMFMENVNNIMETRGFDIIVIDSLEALEVLANFENRRTDLFRLFEWLRDMEATSFIITERSECPFGQHLSHPNNEEGFLADGIISLALYPTSAIDVQRRIRCVKMRGAKHETGYLSLMWDEGRFKVTKAIGR